MMFVVVGGIFLRKRLVGILRSEEHARLDVTTGQRLNAVQDLLVALQQVRSGSKQTQLITIIILIFIELVNLFSTAAKLLEESYGIRWTVRGLTRSLSFCCLRCLHQPFGDCKHISTTITLMGERDLPNSCAGFTLRALGRDIGRARDIWALSICGSKWSLEGRLLGNAVTGIGVNLDLPFARPRCLKALQGKRCGLFGRHSGMGGEKGARSG